MTPHNSPPKLRAIAYYLRSLAYGYPRLVYLEITKKCNARCDFCSCWKEDSAGELSDFTPVIKKLRPIVVSMNGGEPLMRKDVADIVSQVRPYCHYLVMITNGALLNMDKARELVSSGVNLISISLDFLGPEHDNKRKVNGLFAHLEKLIPSLTGAGMNISLNTVIKNSNLHEIVAIAKKAHEWNAGVAFSSYCTLKAENDADMIAKERLPELRRVIEELIALKPKLKNIRSSDHYLKNIPTYFASGNMHGCLAGQRWMQITPTGHIKACSEYPIECHYSEWTPERFKKGVECGKCWYSCRGEAQANPFSPKRLMELIRA